MPRTILISAVLVFLFNLSDNVTVAGRIRVLEFAVCSDHFVSLKHDPAGPIQEAQCKIPAIQQQLANLRAWLGALEALPTLLVGLPLGYYADKVGRRAVLFWSITGMLMNLSSIIAICYLRPLFSASVVLVTPIFLLFGGGKFVFLAMVTSMTIDASPESQRTTNIFLVFLPDLITGIIGPPLGAWLLSLSLWMALISGACALLLTFAVMMLIQERDKLYPAAPGPSRGEHEPLNQADSQGEATDSICVACSNEGINSPSTAYGPRLRIAVRFNELADVFRGVSSFPLNRNVALALASVVVSTATQFDDILLPFLSITYNWSLAKASNILPLIAVLNLGFAFALPKLSKTLRTASNLSSAEVDWALAVGSVLPIVVGALLIGLWRTKEGTVIGLIVQTAGYGNRLFLLSLLPYVVPPDTQARLYILLSLVDTLGGFARSALMESLFGLSLQLGGGGSGLPFIVSGASNGSLRDSDEADLNLVLPARCRCSFVSDAGRVEPYL